MGKTAKVRIAYVGDALDNGAMDVKDLAPALLAFSDLVIHINSYLGDNIKIKMMLTPDNVRVGSFDVVLDLVARGFESACVWVDSLDKDRLETIKTLLGIGKDLGTAGGVAIGGLFGLIAYISGRRIKEARQKDGDTVILTLGDGTVIHTHTDTYNIYCSSDIRKDVSKVVAPVKTEGISRFELRDAEDIENKEPIFFADKNNVEAFAAPGKEEEELNCYVNRISVSLISPSFSEELKWRLNDGESTFWAGMKDKKFISSVVHGKTMLTGGDRLDVDCEYRQFLTGSGEIKVERSILEVHGIHRGPVQMTLPFKQED